MTKTEITEKVNQLSLDELEQIISAAYMPAILEGHVSRRIVEECYDTEVFVHIGIVGLMPHIALRLLGIVKYGNNKIKQ